jgi:hypothetical protein
LFAPPPPHLNLLSSKASSEIGEDNFVIKGKTPSTVFENLTDPAKMKDWALGGGVIEAKDCSSDAPVTKCVRSFSATLDSTLSGKICGVWEILEEKDKEFVRFKVTLSYYSEQKTTKEGVLSNPTLEYKSDFNLFESSYFGGTEIIRHTYDYKQVGSALVPIFIANDISSEDEAMALAWGK